MNFSDIFPIPEYLAMPACGFDISDRSFKYLELRKTSRGLRLKKFGKKIIPEGFIINGDIKDPEELSAFLKKHFDNLDIKRLVVSLPEEKAFLSLVGLPKMEEEFLRNAVESQLEEHIPLSAEEAVFDYEIMGADEHKGNTEVMVAAYPRNLIESYKEVFLEAGASIIAFETEGYALRRAVLPAYHKGTDMIVDFGKTHTSFVIVNDGVVRFSSTILIAGDALNEALRKKFSISYEEAEKIKEEKGVLHTEANEEVFGVLFPIVSAIAGEIQRHILYWNSHAEHTGVSSGKEIEYIRLAGGDSNLLGLPEYLSYELKLPTQPANPWINVASFEDYVPEITKSESLSYANALGLALRAAKGYQYD